MMDIFGLAPSDRSLGVDLLGDLFAGVILGVVVPVILVLLAIILEFYYKGSSKKVLKKKKNIPIALVCVAVVLFLAIWAL